MIRFYPGNPTFDVNVRRFGAIGDDSSADYAAIQNAINFVKNNRGYGNIRIPPGKYRIDTELLIDFDNGHLIIEPGAELKQMTYGLSTVQVREADGCSVGGGGKISNPVAKTQITGSNYLDAPARDRASGVWVYECTNTRVYDLDFEDMVVGVYVRPADVTAGIVADNRVSGIRSVRHDFGVVFYGQRNFSVMDVHGSDTEFTQVTAPPHLIYAANDAAARASENVIIANCTDYNNAYSSSFKARNVNGLSMVGLVSLASARGFDMDTCVNFQMLGPQAIDLVDIGDSQAAGINLDACSRGEIVSPVIYIPDDIDDLESIVPRADSSDVTIRGGSISVKQTAGAASAHARIFGTRIRFIDVMVEQRGASKFHFSFESGSQDCSVIRPIVYNTSGARIASMAAGATDSKVEIDRAVLNFSFDPSASISDSGTTSGVSYSGKLLTAALATLPSATLYDGALFIATDAAGNKNPVHATGGVWRYPDGTSV